MSTNSKEHRVTDEHILSVIASMSICLRKQLQAKQTNEEPSEEDAKVLADFSEMMGVSEAWLIEQTAAVVKLSHCFVADICRQLLQESSYNAAEEEVGLLVLIMLGVALPEAGGIATTLIKDSLEVKGIPSRKGVEVLEETLREGNCKPEEERKELPS